MQTAPTFSKPTEATVAPRPGARERLPITIPCSNLSYSHGWPKAMSGSSAAITSVLHRFPEPAWFRPRPVGERIQTSGNSITTERNSGYFRATTMRTLFPSQHRCWARTRRDRGRRNVARRNVGGRNAGGRRWRCLSWIARMLGSGGSCRRRSSHIPVQFDR